ncbi:MAG: FKBP-type peptidyl-prolyl cis-trans isomerase [Deltaproteobacteria bacterium]|nr:FKBP-type peptidyl-prolyl cis-trans isomerase [Deltaproteobacteria bacterium]
MTAETLARSAALILVSSLLALGCDRAQEPDFSGPEEGASSDERAPSGGTPTADNAAAARTPTNPGARPPAPNAIPAPSDVAAAPADATQTESGLAYKVLRPGSNDTKPVGADRVSVHYTGWTTDGNMFDSSIARGEPATFGVTQVIGGWTEMLLLMTEGEKVRVWIPEALAYQGRPGSPAGMLVFEIELVSILRSPTAPTDLAAPPADAERTDSGLSSKVIEAGTGDAHPAETSRVRVHYTGWTTDGNMFDSSRTRGQPAVFPLNRVIAGWTEGLQLMVVGEQRRFWIPENLAYQGRPGAPAGLLVFDVELVAILD